MKSSQGVSERRVLYLHAASAEERTWVIAVETYRPGTLRATMALAIQQDWILQHNLPAIYDTAADEVLDNPNVITERYDCAS